MRGRSHERVLDAVPKGSACVPSLTQCYRVTRARYCRYARDFIVPRLRIRRMWKRRNPYDEDWKSTSKMGSNTNFRTACTTRSATVGIPSLPNLPLAFGIITCRTSTGRNVRDSCFEGTLGGGTPIADG